MEIKRLFHAYIRKLWLLILLSVIGGSIAGYISLYRITPVYQAETTLYIVNRDKTQLLGESLNYNDVVTGRRLVQDYSEIIRSRSVITPALRELTDYNLNEIMLDAMTTVDLKDESNVLVISATWPEAKTATAAANAMSRAFIEKISEITNSDSIGILDEALVPDYPIPISHAKNILIGLLAGFAIAFGTIYVIELFDTTIRSAEDVEHGLKLHVIGIIPEHDIR